MRFYWLAIGVLCTWRITHLFYGEDGPWDAMARLRQRAGNGFWGKLLDCFYCLSLWVAAPFAFFLGENRSERLLLWPALSAGAILLERITASRLEVPPAKYHEDEEENYGLLRQHEKSVPSDDSATNPPATTTSDDCRRDHI